MAKSEKKAPPKKRGNYEEPLKVNGDFMQLIGAVVKDAKSKDKKKLPDSIEALPKDQKAKALLQAAMTSKMMKQTASKK